jgi:hypothetical protein
VSLRGGEEEGRGERGEGRGERGEGRGEGKGDRGQGRVESGEGQEERRKREYRVANHTKRVKIADSESEIGNQVETKIWAILKN